VRWPAAAEEQSTVVRPHCEQRRPAIKIIFLVKLLKYQNNLIGLGMSIVQFYVVPLKPKHLKPFEVSLPKSHKLIYVNDKQGRKN
jgi:hypothetical protein